MASSNMTQREKRRDYIEQWYQTEKSLIRMSGVLLLFAAGLIIAFDQPSDQWTLLAITACIAGGLTLLITSRQPRSRRTTLNFLKEDQQNSRAIFAGMGAIILITQLGIRPLAVIVAVLLAGMAGWYQWRVHKIKNFDALFTKDSTGDHEQ
ncbi:MAG: hypothetical protein WBC91_06065 [Phototrophicaceae bacterium]